MEVFSWKNQFGKWKCHQRDEILRRMFTRAWFWQEGNYFSIWKLVKTFSNVEGKAHFWSFYMFLFLHFGGGGSDKYMALRATYIHSSLIVFLSHNILYFKQNKQTYFCKNKYFSAFNNKEAYKIGSFLSFPVGESHPNNLDTFFVCFLEIIWCQLRRSGLY